MTGNGTDCKRTKKRKKKKDKQKKNNKQQISTIEKNSYMIINSFLNSLFEASPCALLLLPAFFHAQHSALGKWAISRATHRLLDPFAATRRRLPIWNLQCEVKQRQKIGFFLGETRAPAFIQGVFWPNFPRVLMRRLLQRSPSGSCACLATRLPQNTLVVSMAAKKKSPHSDASGVDIMGLCGVENVPVLGNLEG